MRRLNILQSEICDLEEVYAHGCKEGWKFAFAIGS